MCFARVKPTSLSFYFHMSAIYSFIHVDLYRAGFARRVTYVHISLTRFVHCYIFSPVLQNAGLKKAAGTTLGPTCFIL